MFASPRLKAVVRRRLTDQQHRAVNTLGARWRNSGRRHALRSVANARKSRCRLARFLKYLLTVVAIGSFYGVSSAMPSTPASSEWMRTGRETGLPIPRFVSLKSARARMRIGPAFEYAVRRLYQASGLPLEITEEYGNWRQVRDCDGVSAGCIDRFSPVIAQRSSAWLKEMTALRTQAEQTSFTKAELGPRVRVRIRSCTLSWCNVVIDKDQISGFVEKSALWGVYPREVVD
jgi:SH3-like domain-containing protein